MSLPAVAATSSVVPPSTTQCPSRGLLQPLLMLQHGGQSLKDLGQIPMGWEML